MSEVSATIFQGFILFVVDDSHIYMQKELLVHSARIPSAPSLPHNIGSTVQIGQLSNSQLEFERNMCSLYRVGAFNLTGQGIRLFNSRGRIKILLTCAICKSDYTQRNLFEISLNQTEIRLYYHFPIDFDQQTDTVRFLFQINRKMVNTI